MPNPPMAERIMRKSKVLYITIAVGFISVLIYYFDLRKRRYENKSKLRIVYAALSQNAALYGAIPNVVSVPNRDFGLSWRIVIYPFVTNNNFHVLYDKNEPFDSGKNLAVSQAVLIGGKKQLFFPGDDYVSTYDLKGRSKHTTSILRIAGEGTLGDCFSPKIDIPDGKDKTILMVLFPDSNVYWTAPLDLNLDEDADHKMRPELREWMKRKDRMVLFADGSMRLLSNDLTLDEFRAMCTVDGGEKIDLTRHHVLE